MQEKIAELMWAGGERYEGSPDLHMNPMTVKVIARAIVKLIEGKVIWEGEGKIRQYVHKTAVKMNHTDVPLYFKSKLDCKDGQHVRVIVEEIDESRT